MDCCLEPLLDVSETLAHAQGWCGDWARRRGMCRAWGRIRGGCWQRRDILRVKLVSWSGVELCVGADLRVCPYT